MGAPTLRFHKYEGLGNDFIVVDASDEGAISADRATALCDRRFGVGADGVLLLLPSRDERCDVRMRVINADGSVPEMCGNGVRCVALHLARARGAPKLEARVDTDAGPCRCVVDDFQGEEGMVTVDMGVVRVFDDRTLEVDGTRALLTVADAGNPHAVLFGSFSRAEVEHLGPRLATHPSFARGTNVEFSRVAADGIDLVVWERGVGITLACGTGACATAVVACSKQLVARGVAIPVRLPGGRLEVTVDERGGAVMRGPARHVFQGTLP